MKSKPLWEQFRFFIRYAIFWLLLFVVARTAFLFFQSYESFAYPVQDWLRTMWHGLKMDLSVTGYLLLLPAVLFALTGYMDWKVRYQIMRIYTFALLPVILLILLADLEIYKYWGNRLDKEPLRYLASPREAFASVSLWTLLAFVGVFVVSDVVLFRMFTKRILPVLRSAGKVRWKGMLAFLFLAGFLILPIRGGLSISVMNTGSVYFHEQAFPNHAAINVVWNFGQSIAEKKLTSNPFPFFEGDSHKKALEKLYASGDSTSMVLGTKRPNIIVIVLESFSAKLIEVLGGAPDVTPQFNALSGEGVLFSRMYSSAVRTDRGLAAVLSGFPVLSSLPILAYSEKTSRLPYLSHSLLHEGYHNTLTYGGEIDFANMRSYFINGGFSQIQSDEDYPLSERLGKWGIPDDIMFDHFYEEVMNDEGPFFKVLLTLSNHEPFELPVPLRFGNQNPGLGFYSTAFFTDSCLGNFVHKLKQTEHWNDLLIILVADHGSRLPDYSADHEEKKFHIPVLWLGGAIQKDTVVTKYGSQADIAVTLLRQMDLETDDFILGKDMLSPLSRSFSFYSYKDGVGMITDTAGFGLNFTHDELDFSYGNVTDSLTDYARAMQQYVYDRYIGLSEVPIPLEQ